MSDPLHQILLDAAGLCGVPDHIVASVQSNMDAQYIHHPWQLEELDTAAWHELDAPLGLMAAVRRQLRGAAPNPRDATPRKASPPPPVVTVKPGPPDCWGELVEQCERAEAMKRQAEINGDEAAAATADEELASLRCTKEWINTQVARLTQAIDDANERGDSGAAQRSASSLRDIKSLSLEMATRRAGTSAAKQKAKAKAKPLEVKGPLPGVQRMIAAAVGSTGSNSPRGEPSAESKARMDEVRRRHQQKSQARALAAERQAAKEAARRAKYTASLATPAATPAATPGESDTQTAQDPPVSIRDALMGGGLSLGEHLKAGKEARGSAEGSKGGAQKQVDGRSWLRQGLAEHRQKQDVNVTKQSTRRGDPEGRRTANGGGVRDVRQEFLEAAKKRQQKLRQDRGEYESDDGMSPGRNRAEEGLKEPEKPNSESTVKRMAGAMAEHIARIGTVYTSPGAQAESDESSSIDTTLSQIMNKPLGPQGRQRPTRPQRSGEQTLSD